MFKEMEDHFKKSTSYVKRTARAIIFNDSDDFL